MSSNFLTVPGQSDKNHQRNENNFIQVNVPIPKVSTRRATVNFKESPLEIPIKTSPKNTSKKKISDEGIKQMKDLVKYLYMEQCLVETLELDEEDRSLVSSLDEAVDLDGYFKPEERKVIRMRKHSFFRKERQEQMKCEFKEHVYDPDDSRVAVISRFGAEKLDNCKTKLSLPFNAKDVIKRLPAKKKTWDEIMQEADDILSVFETSGKIKRMGRRGSLFQPRFVFITPCHESGWLNKVTTAHCLPLRKWTSEVFLESKEAQELLDANTKRNLKWNTSVEDFRHLFSADLSHFGTDLNSLLVQTQRRQSICPPIIATETINFRRNSYFGGMIPWKPLKADEKRKREYSDRLTVLHHQRSSSFSSVKSNESSSSYHSTSSYDISGRFVDTYQLDIDLICFIRSHPEKVRSQEIEELYSDLQGDYDFLEQNSAEAIARELTLITKGLFLALTQSEVISLLMKPHLTKAVYFTSILTLKHY